MQSGIHELMAFSVTLVTALPCRCIRDRGTGRQQHEVRWMHSVCQAHPAQQPWRSEGSREPADRDGGGEAAPRTELSG